ncbi:MAG: ABC transporter ATP-binding protein/permease [Holosporaceae bacterium]|jgi:subfamily B ATP-binding cassette protein MsbA|nr:ABC transporter ATP-binding protein/permease [Holosporaceae bacterium]
MAIAVTFPVGMMDVAIPWALKNYMDAVTTGKSTIISAYMPLLILIFTVAQSGFVYLSTYLNSWVGAKISNGLKYDLFAKLMRYDASFFDKNVSGSIQVRFNNDVDTACSGFLGHLKIFFTRIFNSGSLLIALFVISWRLAIIAVVVLLLALYPLTTVRKRIDSVVRKTVFSGALISTHYLEAFSGNRVVTSYNLYGYQKRKIVDTLEYAFKLSMKMIQHTGILSPMMHLIVGAGIASIIWVGSYLISHSYLTAGGFVAFTTSVIMLYQPIKTMGNDLKAVQMSLMAIERVFSLLQEKSRITSKPNAVILDDVKEKIEYKNVSFEYEKDRPVLKNINLSVKVGKTIALVGNSGGGKSTFVNLLPRFYDVTSGEITLDGINVKDIDLDSLREKIAFVFQDNFLFGGTIRDNILLGKLNASQEEINTAVESACLKDFISTLKKGLDTEIGERGVFLSGGQKQRVAIARAFIKNAPIVVLDEATSALDNKSEAVVQKAINNLMKNRTVFVIAHRLSTIKNADKIVLINQGKIVESGRHNKLLNKKNGAYAALYNAHFK